MRIPRLHWPRVLGAALFAAALVSPQGGCSSKHHMMPVPLAIREGGSATFDLVAPDHRSPTVPVLYATNREPGGQDAEGSRYRAANGREIRLGAASVRLGPSGWDWDRLNRETLAGARPGITVMQVQEFGVLGAPASPLDLSASMSAEGIPVTTEARFASAINAMLKGCSRKDIFVYVPGINQTFEVGLRRMAEMSHFLEGDGVFLTYAWPAHPHPFAYDADRRSAVASVDGFIGFLRYLEAETDAEHINIITNSAGAPLVTGALLAFRDLEAGLSPDEMRRRTRLGQIVYAASDQEINAFCDMLVGGVDEVAEHITVYSSSIDLGLVLTRHFGSGDKTIGRLPANLTEPVAAMLRDHSDRVTVVDVTSAVQHAGRGDIWAHSYWYLNPWVSSDLLGVLRHGLAPAERGLDPTHGGAMWSFPSDYPDRLHAEMAACPLVAETHAAR